MELSKQKTFDLVDLGVLTSGYDRDFEFSVTLAARAARAPIATFATVDQREGLSRLRASVGFAGRPEVTVIPLELSVVQLATCSEDIFAISDTRNDPRTAAHPFLAKLGIRSLLGAPILCPAEEVVGLLAVHDTMPRIWSADDRTALTQVAYFCTQAILLRAALKTLSLISQEIVDSRAAI